MKTLLTVAVLFSSLSIHAIAQAEAFYGGACAHEAALHGQLWRIKSIKARIGENTVPSTLTVISSVYHGTLKETLNDMTDVYKVRLTEGYNNTPLTLDVVEKHDVFSGKDQCRFIKASIAE